MLELVLDVEQVKRLGSLKHVTQQQISWDAQQTPRLMLVKDLIQVGVRQFHDDDQVNTHQLDALQREEERVAYDLNALQGEQFLLSQSAIAIHERVFAQDEFDGFE
jgi:hypothetical protein